MRDSMQILPHAEVLLSELKRYRTQSLAKETPKKCVSTSGKYHFIPHTQTIDSIDLLHLCAHINRTNGSVRASHERTSLYG